MAQLLHVVCCVDCKTYQVHIVKKSKKWVCKICTTKQSLIRVFHEGLGSECRSVVQALNAARGQQEEQQNIYAEEVSAISLADANIDNQGSFDNLDYYTEDPQLDGARSAAGSIGLASDVPVVPASKSKWTKFCDDSKASELFFE